MLYFCFLSILLCVVSCNSEKDDLRSVIVIFRHGERTPLFPYPNDPYNEEKYWPEGLCQLTEIGKTQCFELGKWLQNRYNNFLPAVYNMRDIHFRSTNRDRTLMSVGYLAAGLYGVRNSNSPTIVPIHSRPILQDNLLLMRSVCPRYNELKRRVYQSSTYADIHRKNEELFKFLSEKTGKTVRTVDDILEIFDTLRIEKKRNLKLPEWTLGVFPEPLKNLSLLSMSAEVSNKDMARLKPGLLLNWILEHFNHVLDEKPPFFFRDFKGTDYHQQKFVVFSCHDHVIVNILRTFGLFDMKWPYVSSALIFEYRGNDGKEKYVNFLYKNSTKNVAKLTLKNCSFNCPFHQFQKVVEPFAVNEEIWIKECLLKL